MKQRIITFSIIMVIFSIIIFDLFNQKYTIAVKTIPTPTPTPQPYIFSEKLLFELIQDWKYEHDGYTYSMNKHLCDYATKRLPENISKISHDGFYKSVSTLYNFGFNKIGENLASEYNTERQTFTSWLNSPKHLEILEANFTHSCLKCDTSNPLNKNVCVHIFASF